jgi:hypothetical protein
MIEMEKGKRREAVGECRKWQAKCEVMGEQIQTMLKDNCKMEQTIARMGEINISLGRKAGDCLGCARLIMDNEKLHGRVKKYETMMNYQRKENIIHQISKHNTRVSSPIN